MKRHRAAYLKELIIWTAWAAPAGLLGASKLRRRQSPSASMGNCLHPAALTSQIKEAVRIEALLRTHPAHETFSGNVK